MWAGTQRPLSAPREGCQWPGCLASGPWWVATSPAWVCHQDDGLLNLGGIVSSGGEGCGHGTRYVPPSSGPACALRLCSVLNYSRPTCHVSFSWGPRCLPDLAQLFCSPHPVACVGLTAAQPTACTGSLARSEPCPQSCHVATPAPLAGQVQGRRHKAGEQSWVGCSSAGLPLVGPPAPTQMGGLPGLVPRGAFQYLLSFQNQSDKLRKQNKAGPNHMLQKMTQEIMESELHGSSIPQGAHGCPCRSGQGSE